MGVGDYTLSWAFPGQADLGEKQMENVWEGNLRHSLIGNGEGKTGTVERSVETQLPTILKQCSLKHSLLIFIRISYPAGEHGGSELSPTPTECIFFTNIKVILNFLRSFLREACLKGWVEMGTAHIHIQRVFFKLFHKAKESHVLQKFLGNIKSPRSSVQPACIPSPQVPFLTHKGLKKKNQ